MLARVAQKLAGEVPECSNWAYAAQAAAILTLGTPGVGLMSHLIQPASVWMPGGLFIPEATLGVLTVSLSSLIVSKLAIQNRWSVVHPRKRARQLGISLGGMTFNESALFTNIIAFGAIGSGKTSAVVFPILDSITALYRNDDPKEPDAKWGGFVLDVKGDFHEALIYVMQTHGRDLLEDLVVIRPDDTVLAGLFAEAGLATVICHAAEQGMGHSLAAGVAASADAAGWLVVLADMPYIQPASYRAVLDAMLGGATLARPLHDGLPGHPVGFSAEHLDALLALTGDQGGKAILDAHRAALVNCPVLDPGVLKDVDLPVQVGLP